MSTIEIKVPDVGNVGKIDVVEVLIQTGDIVTLDQTIATLETDKASMELPTTAAGTVQQVHIKVGDKVSEGSLVATVLLSETDVLIAEPSKPAPAAEIVKAVEIPVNPSLAKGDAMPTIEKVATGSIFSQGLAHASPAVRLFARELGVDISKISTGSGRKGRILKEDVQQYVKKVIVADTKVQGAGIPPIPEVDFTPFGETEIQKLSKIKRLTGQNLTRVWLNLPLVTYHDEADITEMEAFRVTLNSEKKKDELKITGLCFIIKALATALQQHPCFNASLSADGENLILKKYVHIGIAVDTPNGLVVPVLRNVNTKSINDIALELAEKSEKARLGKLLPSDMQGGCISISSLGGLGGTSFTPIVNAPEVAILGVTRAKIQPVWNGTEFMPRLMLPLDITYDHRVIDGVEGARFMNTLKYYLGDIRRLLV